MKFSFPSDESLDQASRDEIMSHLFTGLVLQHSQLAMMMLGRVADPDSGLTPPKDLESAKMFIDLLEMLTERLKLQRSLSGCATSWRGPPRACLHDP